MDTMSNYEYAGFAPLLPGLVLFTPDEQLLLDEVGFSNNTWPVFK
jgi:hypothetical protein